MDYRYVLFDLDGTLSDSAAGVIAAIELTMAHYGHTPPDRETMISFVGPPLINTFRDHFGVTEDELPEVMRVFRGFYAGAGMEQQCMFDGVAEMLERLHSAGKTLAVATSKREFFAKQVCDDYGISKYFALIVGNTDDGARSEKHEVVEHILSELGVTNRAQALMVGDRLFDVEGAKTCGIDCMGVLYGYGGRRELENAGAKYFAETPADVARLILE